jgi:hypothetical protein
MKPKKKTPVIKAWLPWYGDDFYGSFAVKSMSLEEEAVYHRWIWTAWCDNKCSLPCEDAALRKLSAGFGGDLSRLLSCWYLGDDNRLYNERLLALWQEAKEISRKATESVNERWRHVRSTNVDTNTIRSEVRPLYSSHPSSSPSSSSDSKPKSHTDEESLRGEHAPPASLADVRVGEKSVEKKKAANGAADFDAFWLAYPNKTGGLAARKAWNKTKHRPQLVVLLAAIDKQRHSKRWTEGKIPNPAKWLEEGRWKDTPPERPPAPERKLVL